MSTSVFIYNLGLYLYYCILPLIIHLPLEYFCFFFFFTDHTDKLDSINRVRASSNLQIVYQNRIPSIAYKVYIEAVVLTTSIDKKTNGTIRVTHNSLPATLVCHTSPRAPHSLSLVKADYNNVSITWSPPYNIGAGEIVTEYLVKYQTMAADGRSLVQGTEKVQSALAKTNLEVTGLVMGMMYSFSVKVSVLVTLLVVFVFFSLSQERGLISLSAEK